MSSANKSKRRRLEEISQKTNNSKDSLLSQTFLTNQSKNGFEAQSQYQNRYLSSGTSILSNVSPGVPQMSQYISDDFKLDDICNDCKRSVISMNGKDIKEYIKCDLCQLSYHLECVELNPRIYALIKETKTVKWICDQCVDHKKNRSLLSII